MTKSREKGDNEYVDQVRREAMRTGRDVCDILVDLMRDAKRRRDTRAREKLITAEKYFKCRYRRKRRSQ